MLNKIEIDLDPLSHKNKLLERLDLKTFVAESLLWAKKHANESLAKQWELFTQELWRSKANSSEKFILLKAAFRVFDNKIERGELALFLTYALKIKADWGLDLFHRLFTTRFVNGEQSLGNYILISQLLINLPVTQDLVLLVESILPSALKLVDQLREKQANYLATKFQSKSIDEVIQRFAIQDEWLQFPLAPEELAQMRSEYIKVNAEIMSLQDLSQGDLKSFAHQPKSVHQLIAIIMETSRRVIKISPHTIQLLAFLVLKNKPEQLKGRVAQIKTGEGKTLIIAMLAGFFACQGKKVDIVTSSSYLARFGSQNNQAFFNALGLSASFITDEEADPVDFKADVIYGTNTAFEFVLLKDGFYCQESRAGRPYEVVIVDEADNFFIDLARQSARIAKSVPVSEDHSWIYAPLLSFIQNEKNKNRSAAAMVEEFKTFLLTKLPKTEQENLKKLSQCDLTQYLESAQDVWYHKKIKEEYVIKKIGKKEGLDIVPVEVDTTGRLSMGCQWQHGRHQLLQIKHNLDLSPRTLSAASISHCSFFNLYENLVALTGTIGNFLERQEILKIYSVESFDVPTYFPSLREKLPPQLLKNELEQFKAILKFIEEMRKAKRPTLILFRTIETSERFKKYLNNQNAQLLNEDQPEDEDFIIARAGEAGRVTIATNTAGRGTDIKISREVNKEGGLLTIFTFYPKSQRVEDQGFGRAARWGDKGSCVMILDEEHEFPNSFLTRKPSLKNEEKMNLLEQIRNERIKQESLSRIQCAKRETLFFEKLKLFFEQIKKLDNLGKNKDFTHKIIQCCEQSEPHSAAFDFKGSEWVDLKVTASLLMQKQQKGIPMDWSYFVEQFKEVYLSHIRYCWAVFFSQMQNESNENLEVLKVKLEKEYKKVKRELDQYFSQPETQLVACLKALLSEVQNLKMGYSGNKLESSMDSPMESIFPSAHDQLLCDLKNYFKQKPIAIEKTELLIKTIDEKNYSLALRQVCTTGKMCLIKIFSKYTKELNIDWNEKSSKGNTPWDWFKASPAKAKPAKINKMETVFKEQVSRLKF